VRWTIRTLARALGITQHQVRQIWAEAGIRPHSAPEHAMLRSTRAGPRTSNPEMCERSPNELAASPLARLS
jgi:hypothetical protein